MQPIASPSCGSLNPIPADPLIFIVEDDSSVRDSLETMFRWAGFQAESFATAQAFLGRSAVLGPSCLILDLNLPDLNGLDLQRRVAVARKDMPIIFITGDCDVPTSVQAMKAGAVEFLTKPFCHDALLHAARESLKRSRAMREQDEMMRSLLERYASLSPRELEVMNLVVAGLMNKQIGFELGISEITVKAHRGKMMHKMDAASVADLVRMSARLGCDTPAKSRYGRSSTTEAILPADNGFQEDRRASAAL
jgi:FixJ family two-component response regulator